MKFSIIMPSRLVPYKGIAQLPEKKIIRAIRSVLDQSFKDFELIIISDECEQTKKIVSGMTDERIVLLECKHKAVFDNLPRNTGIENAKGEFITYCDIDDYIGENHLAIINYWIRDYDWIWYNDYYYNDQWMERACNIRSHGGCGTSNLTHKRSLEMKWERPGYAHDYHFAQRLLRVPNHTKTETPEYYCCHIPGIYDY